MFSEDSIDFITFSEIATLKAYPIESLKAALTLPVIPNFLINICVDNIVQLVQEEEGIEMLGIMGNISNVGEGDFIKRTIAIQSDSTQILGRHIDNVSLSKKLDRVDDSTNKSNLYGHKRKWRTSNVWT